MFLLEISIREHQITSNNHNQQFRLTLGSSDETLAGTLSVSPFFTRWELNNKLQEIYQLPMSYHVLFRAPGGFDYPRRQTLCLLHEPTWM